MRTLRTFIAACGASALLACTSTPDGFELEISPQRLHEGMAKQFPKEDCRAVLLCVGVTAPQIRLVNGSPRIGMRVGLTARAPALSQPPSDIGFAEISSKLRYERSEANLYVDDVKVDELNLRGVPPGVSDAIRKLAPELVASGLTTKPIYSIPSDKLSEKLKRMTLKDLRVKDGKLVAVVGL